MPCRAQLELFEQSYASKRRRREEAEQARQRRAFKREVLLGRLIMVGGMAGMVGGAMAIWRPQWLVGCSRALDELTSRLAQPRKLLKRVVGLLIEGTASARSMLAKVQLAAVDA